MRRWCFLICLLLMNTVKGQEMTCSPQHTYFSLWSPKAETVRVNLYENDSTRHIARRLLLARRADGQFSRTVLEDLRGWFYTFQVRQDGRWLPESPGIFAKAVGVNGRRAQVLDLRQTDPEGWQQDKRPAFRPGDEAVVYEMHHRDLSIGAASGIAHKGKFLALTETGTRTPDGQATGIDHLKELGVTHVHLLPSYDFGSVDERRLDRPQYNWGYDPVNYNVPEGSYSTNPADPAVRIREFKQMVQALHRAGIRVVMDVVYNHVFDLNASPLQRTAPGYFFRWTEDGKPANGSGCGNETASEQPMMRRFMVESVLHWVREYHIDGFRFDLMGIHDIETMQAIRDALDAIDPSIIMYGEGWAASSPALPAERLAMKANMAQLPGIAAFGDELRDGLRGPWDNDEKGAFLVGVAGNEESIKFGLAGAVVHDGVDMGRVNYSKEPWAASPRQMISYVSCHDDMCLADRIKATLPKAQWKDRARLHTLAYTAVFASRGIPFIWCGDEIMRDRKGVHNCYKSPDSVNAIPWELKGENREVFDYLCQLVRLRKTTRWSQLPVQFLPVSKPCVVASLHGEKFIVLLNGNRTAVVQALPEGRWQIIASEGKLDESGALGTAEKKLKVPARTAMILRKAE